MAVGRISGPLLKSNLLRNGIDLAFETDLLYLDVNNGRIGVKTNTPGCDLQVNGTFCATSVNSELLTVDNVEIDGSTIRTLSGDLNVQAATAFDKVYIPRVQIPDVQGDVTITGSLHATGNITADGTITLGDADTDNVVFNADINSDILPNITDQYFIGNPSKRWRSGHFHNINVGNVQIQDNIIEPVTTNDDLIIRANGTGIVDIYGLQIDAGGDVSLAGTELRFGNIRIDGDGDATGIYSLESNTNMYVESHGTGRVYINGVDILLEEGNTYYVTPNGDDGNSGTAPNDAFATIAYALTQASSGDIVLISSGTFEEVAPLTVPVGVTIRGQGIRATQLKPTAATRTNDFFRLNGETTIESLTVREIEYDSLSDTGYAFTYAPGAVITTRSAYIKDSSVINFGSSVRLGTNPADDPYGYNAGDAGRGVKMDGSILGTSIEAAMLFDSVTFITPNSVGMYITEGGRVEWLNSFIYFASQGILGEAGTTGLYGDGKTYITLGGVASGPFQAETVRFTSTDGSTVIDATVESVDGNTLVIDGRFDDLDGEDLTYTSNNPGAGIVGLTSGATATHVISYNRKEFAAELRSIASANIYGIAGVKADGPDVRLRLSSHDFGYIGSGKEFDNDDTNVIQANEVDEQNGGRVFYSSTDQFGDYRIGDLFRVDQDTGAVTFTGGSFDVTSLTGITFSDGSNTTIVDPTKLQTGNIIIAGNSIITTTGGITIDPVLNEAITLNSPTNIVGNTTVNGTFDVSGQTEIASLNVEDLTDGRVVLAGTDGELEDSANLTFDGTLLTVTGNQYITGNLTVDGDITLGGNIQIGDQDTDSITVAADFESHLIPNADVSYNLGSTSKRWNQLYSDKITSSLVTLDTIQTDDIRIASNRIETTASNANLEILANGSGVVNILDAVDIDGTLNVDGVVTFNNDFNATGTYTHTGTISVSNNLLVYGEIFGGPVNTDDIRIASNRIETTASNADLELLANGLGIVRILDDLAIVGDVTITDNLSVSGDITVNGDTVNAGNLSVTDDLFVTGEIYGGPLNTDDIRIAGNRIETTASNSNLELDTVGTGTIELLTDTNITGNLDVSGNINLGGNLTIGNQDVDTVTVVADFTSNLIPDAPNLYDLGSSTKGWRTLHIGQIEVDSIEINDNYIRTQESNANLELRPNGTGTVVIDSDQAIQIPVGSTGVRPSGITGQIRFNTDTQQFEGYQGTAWSSLGGVRDVDGDTYIQPETGPGTDEDTLYFYTGGNLSAALDSSLFQLNTNFSVVGDINGGALNTDDIRIAGNRIETTASNANFEIEVNGTGTIELLANTNVTGTFDVNGQTELASVNVEDLTAGRVVLAGTDGELEDNGNLTFGNVGGVDTLTITGNAKVTGDIDVSGDIYLGGNIRVGDQDVDTIEVIADFTSDLIPNGPNLYNLGSAIKGWKTLYTGQIEVDSIEINDNYIRIQDSNADLELRPQGTGTVYIDTDQALRIPVGSNAVRPAGITGQIRFNTDTQQFEGYQGTAWSSLGGVRDVDGDTYIQPEIGPGTDEDTLYFYTGGQLSATLNQDEFNVLKVVVDDITIEGNRIQTEISNSNLEFNANGTGYIDFVNTNSIKLPVGDSAQRGSGTTGQIRFNTDSTQFEGFNGSAWSSLGGVRDVDGDTYIAPELSSGSDEDTLYFYNAGNLNATLDNGTFKVFDNNIENNELRINDNTIRTIQSNADLVLSGNGTGIVYLDGTSAVRIPAGNVADRPASGVAGMIRYNTATNTIEAWNGSTFASVGGGSLTDTDADTYATVETAGNDEDTFKFFVGSNNPEDSPQSKEMMSISRNGVLIDDTIQIRGNVIESVNTNEDLILRAAGTGRVIIEGSPAEGASSGNVFFSDPLTTLNYNAIGNNQVDIGLIFERGIDINKGIIYDESADEFAFISTIEQGTVKGNVAITDYQDVSVASVKLNSETANKVTFTDADKIVRSIDSGDAAEVDGEIAFSSTGNLEIPTGTTLQRPSTPDAGSIRYNTDLEYFEGFDGAAWSGLGISTGTPADFQKFIGDGATFEFLLKKEPYGTGAIMVSINGVVQEPDFAYTIDGRILRFIDESSSVVAPEDEARIDVRFLSAPSYQGVRRYEYTGDGSNQSFDVDLEITDGGTLMVFVENIYQDPAVYNASGKTVTFTDDTPADGDRISIVQFATIISPNVITRQEAEDAAIVYAIALG